MASWVAALLDWGATNALAPPAMAAIATAAENFMVERIVGFLLIFR
jgi:hypothetical protein